MFQAAIASVAEMEHKQVVGGGRALHAHQTAAGQADRFEMFEPVGIALNQFAALQHRAPAHPAVGHTGNTEVVAAVGPHLDRRIDQLVEVLG